jgi:hypothetical protein
LHGFDRGRRGFRGRFGASNGFHTPIMPQSTGNGCRLHHTALVMNVPLDVYFRRATLVHNFRGNTLPLLVRSPPET